MLNLAQVNIGYAPITPLAMIYVILGAVYLVSWIIWFKSKASRDNTFIFQIIQAIFVTIILEMYGFILLYHGWRLNPPLQLSQLLLFFVLFYFIIRDSLNQMTNKN